MALILGFHQILSVLYTSHLPGLELHSFLPFTYQSELKFFRSYKIGFYLLQISPFQKQYNCAFLNMSALFTHDILGRVFLISQKCLKLHFLRLGCSLFSQIHCVMAIFSLFCINSVTFLIPLLFSTENTPIHRGIFFH